jgi:dihydroxyacetone kinase
MKNVMAVCKIIGAAAAAGRTFEDVLALGTAASSNLASVATSLDHCHVPGRTEFTHLGDDVCEIGMGLHNEPVCLFKHAELGIAYLYL